MSYTLGVVVTALVAITSVIWFSVVHVAARQHYPQIRQFNVVAEGQSAMTGVSWHITPASGDEYRVEFSLPNFKVGMWAGIGFSLNKFMPNSFIITCAKGSNGVGVVQARYATAHAEPPLFDWGVKPQESDDPNKCVALVAAFAKTPTGGEINLAGRREMNILTARGTLISGRPAYHGMLKEAAGVLRFTKR